MKREDKFIEFVLSSLNFSDFKYLFLTPKVGILLNWLSTRRGKPRYIHFEPR